jgi:hypothetical protein
VTAATAGVKNNQSGAVSASYDDGSGSFVGITGNTASASLSVAPRLPPVISGAFAPASITLPNGTSRLAFTIRNPNATLTLTGISFVDILPAGLVVGTPANAVGICGGSLHARQSTIVLSDGRLEPGSGCTVTFTVKGRSPGTMRNTSGAVASNEAGPGGVATASITIRAPRVRRDPRRELLVRRYRYVLGMRR